MIRMFRPPEKPDSTPESVFEGVTREFSDDVHTLERVATANPTEPNKAALSFLKGQQEALQNVLETDQKPMPDTTTGPRTP